MQSLINNYGRLIDQIRKDRKVSRHGLCEDIMSERNFQRFANGEISISNDKIVKLIDRLNLDYFTLNQLLKSISNDDYSKVIKAHQQLRCWNNDKAAVILATIDKDSIISKYSRFLYSYVEIMVKKRNESIESNEFYDKLKTLINYPEILSYKIINIAELNCLIF